MTYTAITDTFGDDPRLLECSRDARLLHVEALVYCNRHLTDGVLAYGALPRITDSPDALAAAAELEAAGLWSPVRDRAAWQVEWKHQEASSEVARRRALNAARQARLRAHRAGDHSGCLPRFCNALRNSPSNALVTPSPPLPPQEGEGGAAGEAAAAPSPAAEAAPVVTSEPEPLDPEAEARLAALRAETHAALASIRAAAKSDPPLTGEARRIQEPEPAPEPEPEPDEPEDTSDHLVERLAAFLAIDEPRPDHPGNGEAATTEDGDTPALAPPGGMARITRGDRRNMMAGLGRR